MDYQLKSGFKPPTSLLKILSLLIFFSCLFLLGGISPADTAVIIGITCFQILAGSIIWKHFTIRITTDLIEIIGMGGAIGFALSLISSQIFRDFLPASVAWLILPGLSVLISFAGVSHENQQAVVGASTKSDLFFILAGLLIAISKLWFWLIPLPLSMMFLAFWIFVKFDLSLKDLVAKRLLYFLAIIGALSAFRPIINLFALGNLRNQLWWSLNGVRQSPDLIFYESLINSVQSYGNSDNIFMSGYKLNYHWLAFAWQATLGTVTKIDSFAISGVASNVIVVFITLCLIWSITRKLTESLWAAPVAIAVVCMICSSGVPFASPLNISPSYSFSLIYLYALVNLLLTPPKCSVLYKTILILLFSFVVLGSKVSTGPIVVAGFFSLGIISLFIRQISVRATLIYAGSGMLGSALAFKYLYQFQESGSMNKFSFKLGALIQQEGPLSYDLALPLQLIISIAVILIFGQPLLGLIGGFRFLERDITNTLIFVLCGGFVSIILGFSLFHDLECTQYFVQAGLAILIPFSVAAIISKIEKSESWNTIFVVLMLLIGFTIAKITWTFYVGAQQSTDQLFWQTIALLSPIVISSSVTGIVVLIQHFSMGRFFKIKFSSVVIFLLLSSSAGTYLINAPGYYKIGTDVREWKWPDSDLLVGSRDYRELLVWLKNNSMKNDLVSTNRFCQVATDLPPTCPALWSLTSAITNRQMLAEGVYPAGVSESERATRVDLVDSFVDEPSEQSRTALLDYGVRWVVADFAVAKNRNWGEFAEVRFENKAGAILELVP